MFGKLKTGLCVAALAGLSLLAPASAMAQENTVTFSPLVSFGNLFDGIQGIITPLMVTALTLMLGIWGTKFIFRIIKSMAR